MESRVTGDGCGRRGRNNPRPRPRRGRRGCSPGRRRRAWRRRRRRPGGGGTELPALGQEAAALDGASGYRSRAWAGVGSHPGGPSIAGSARRGGGPGSVAGGDGGRPAASGPLAEWSRKLGGRSPGSRSSCCRRNEASAIDYLPAERAGKHQAPAGLRPGPLRLPRVPWDPQHQRRPRGRVSWDPQHQRRRRGRVSWDPRHRRGSRPRRPAFTRVALAWNVARAHQGPRTGRGASPYQATPHATRG